MHPSLGDLVIVVASSTGQGSTLSNCAGGYAPAPNPRLQLSFQAKNNASNAPDGSDERAEDEQHMAARQQWREGVQVVFPPGTYWLRRFAYVPVPVVET